MPCLILMKAPAPNTIKQCWNKIDNMGSSRNARTVTTQKVCDRLLRWADICLDGRKVWKKSKADGYFYGTRVNICKKLLTFTLVYVIMVKALSVFFLCEKFTQKG